MPKQKVNVRILLQKEKALTFKVKACFLSFAISQM